MCSHLHHEATPAHRTVLSKRGELIYVLRGAAILVVLTCCMILPPFAITCTVGAGDAPSARNVIILIGDGMGIEHIDLTRICTVGEYGELNVDYLDDDPGWVTTVSLDGVTDSAAAGTALATGFKTNNGMVSVLADGTVLETVLELAETIGKSTGLISSVALIDATPAVFCSHTYNRGNYADIAAQMAYSGVDVLLGSGEGYFVPKGEPMGQRWDGRDIISEMQDIGYQYVDSREELINADAEDGRLLGFFGGLWAQTYMLDREVCSDEPTLSEMTSKAIEVLDRDEDGFFLMVEGGAIDWVAHNRDPAGVVAETFEFDKAVRVALDFAIEDGSTLVLVTADHECCGLEVGKNVDVGYINGITATTEFIWGKIKSGEMNYESAMSAYANIPKLTKNEKKCIELYGEGGISDVISVHANVEWGWSGMDNGDHTAVPVPVYAFGPNSGQFDGELDNTKIGQLMFISINGSW